MAKALVTSRHQMKLVVQVVLAVMLVYYSVESMQNFMEVTPDSREYDNIPLQTQWRYKSLKKAERVLDVIQQEHADKIDWDFLEEPKPDPTEQTSYIRYGSAHRIPVPHIDTDPRSSRNGRGGGHVKPGRTAFINGHGGTRDDFAYMAHQLGFEYSELDPRAFWFYGINETHADFMNEKGRLGDFFCRSFDTVVVGDTIPDVRFLLQWIDTHADQCTQLSKIVMMTTNRFDFGIKDWDLPSYYALVRRVSKRSTNPRVIWTANNPFDIKYAQVLLGDNIAKFTLIRSFGYSTLPVAQELPKSVTQMPAMFNHYDESRFIAWLKRNKVEVAVFGRNYGGPTSLSQFRAFIDFPYQASTMKMYENLLYGVVTLVPSKRLYVQELEGYIIEGGRVANEWQDYVEYWYKDMRDLVYEFDSVAELKAMLSSEDIDPNNIRERGVAVWKAWNKESLVQWRTVLES
ncbi:hypothetical protein CcCBS67573_g04859 [Chytriomyces confervae]|uniref:Uncharacterized protein n=1 Tax=Chytriomyces confervae TaxID=246404 RepID=A0A507FC00_9FUNG|nr:hypothetical protein HDU80_005614 [Chytriomyces hyalinus]TPX73861.1 hypothetical protein CcCBS67573_g04859 [Chytriomyces confervae]